MDQEIKTLEAADIAKIMQALPHRYPFLMVDRIRDIDGDDSGIGIKNVTFNEPHFHGAFPRPSGHAGRAPDRGHGADGGRALRACARARRRRRSSSTS